MFHSGQPFGPHYEDWNSQSCSRMTNACGNAYNYSSNTFPFPYTSPIISSSSVIPMPYYSADRCDSTALYPPYTSSIAPNYSSYHIFPSSFSNIFTARTTSSTYTAASMMMSSTTNTTFSSTSSPITSLAFSNLNERRPIVHSRETAWSSPSSDAQSKVSDAQMQSIIDSIERIKKSNEQFQSKLLRELKELKDVMADLKSMLNEIPVKFADAMSSSLASFDSRSQTSRTASIGCDSEIIDSFCNIDISKESIEGNTNEANHQIIESKKNDQIIDTNIDSKESNICGSIKLNDSHEKPTNIKFVFEYNSTLDMEKWLRKN